MDIMLEFREPYIRRYVAKETSIVLTKAIQYLLAINGDDMYGLVSTESLMGGFFKNVVGADEQLTREFWRTHFAEVQDSYFPPRKEGKHQPRPDREVTLCAQELEWANRGDFSATTILKAAWSILTTRILGSNEAIFGVTTTDQKAVMPVRVLLDSESIVIELLQKIQRQAADMALFERTGLQRIRSISEEASLGCDFQSLLHVVDRQIGEHRSPLLDRTAEEWQQRFDNHAMVIECQIQKNETITTIKFDSDMIGELQVTRIGHQFEHILRQLLHLDLRDQKLGDLAVVSPRDVNDIWSWNATVPEPVDECVHDMVFQRAHEQPLASAIHAWDGDLTYRQLLRLSTELAHELAKKGVGPGNIVPLCFEKSMWMSVAALALTQTGAAAVALDPVSQTEDRMRAITIQVKGNIILSSVANEALAHRLGINDVVVVGPKRLSLSFRVHDTLGTITQRRLGSPAASPSDVLYVMFTSGAGGIPKGVQVLHRNFSSAIAYQQGALGYTQSARVLDFSSYACDVFWSNLLNTLTAGELYLLISVLTQT
jgi:non-ribosomal peptide synthetase component F